MPFDWMELRSVDLKALISNTLATVRWEALLVYYAVRSVAFPETDPQRCRAVRDGSNQVAGLGFEPRTSGL